MIDFKLKVILFFLIIPLIVSTKEIKKMEYLALVKIGNLYGYIDRTGEVIIKPQYKTAFSFKNGLAYAEAEDKIGFINGQGQMIITFNPDHYILNNFFNDKRACIFRRPRMYMLREERRDDVIVPVDIEITEGAGFINTAGTIVIEPEYDWVEDFSEGLAVAAKGAKVIGNNLIEAKGKWGYVTPTGKLAIEMVYEQARSFHEGMAAVKLNGLWGYINKKGEIVIKPQFSKAFDFSNGLASVNNGLKYGFINKQGKLIIDYKYDSVNDLQDGFIAVNEGAVAEKFIDNEKRVIGGNWFFLNSNGNIAFEDKYNDIRNYSEGYAFVYYQGEWAIINKKGNKCTPFKYKEAKEFKNGLAPVKIEDKWGYINIKGEIVIKPLFDDAFEFIEIE